jgi:DNA-binding MarR family transcriptional regulator
MTIETFGSDHDLTPAELRRTMRELLVGLNDIGVALTQAIERNGGRGRSGNAAVGVLIVLLDGPLRPRDLLTPSGLTSAGLTNLLDRFEHADLIGRSHGTLDDRRGVVVTLTTHGRAIAEQILDAFRRAFDAQLPRRREVVRLLGVTSPRHRDISPVDVVERMAALGHGLGRVLRADDYPDDPTPSKTALTLALASGDGTRPRVLIDATQLSTGGVTLLLDRLEGRGFISRASGRPPDRRAVIVRSTPAGDAALNLRLDQLASLDRAIYDVLY